MEREIKDKLELLRAVLLVRANILKDRGVNVWWREQNVSLAAAWSLSFVLLLLLSFQFFSLPIFPAGFFALLVMRHARSLTYSEFFICQTLPAPKKTRTEGGMGWIHCHQRQFTVRVRERLCNLDNDVGAGHFIH